MYTVERIITRLLHHTAFTGTQLIVRIDNKVYNIVRTTRQTAKVPHIQDSINGPLAHNEDVIVLDCVANTQDITIVHPEWRQI